MKNGEVVMGRSGIIGADEPNPRLPASSYEPTGPRTNRLQILFIVLLLLGVLLSPVIAIYPAKPATLAGWLLLYGVGVPAYVVVAGLLQVVTARSAELSGKVLGNPFSRMLAFAALVVVAILLAYLWRHFGAQVAHLFESW